MNNTLFLFVGKSASGKTTAADFLENKHGLVQLKSYTTRAPRHENEIAHTFVTDEEFDKLKDIVAYTEYSGFKYGATAEQVDNISIYVIDIPGVETLLEKYQTERPIVVVYFDANICSRIDRMIDRHDSDMSIVARIYNDEGSDWESELSKLVWHYKNNVGRNITMHKIDANENTEYVFCKIVDLVCNEMEN